MRLLFSLMLGAAQAIAQDNAGGERLSSILRQQEITASMLLLALAIAFGLGAVHALSPGHGKTLVAAYLVGTRGTLRHAIVLGGVVTFTHTISVFLLGLATLFLTQYVVPERIFPVLGVISGLMIVGVGGWLLVKRWQAARAGRVHHHHHHGHPHHDHPHETHDHPHEHSHVAEHDDGHHRHIPEGDVSMGALLTLGASGGLVPCPSALVLLLSSIALGHVALGLILLVSFSAGLALVLIAIGAAVLYAKRLAPARKAASHPIVGWLPVVSSVVIIVAGLVVTSAALGWIRV
ncbi:MAG: high frequency lysogenization protein HflD [Acidobacteria bacterium]|nr:high frequency lysogenization protein HflD [Acidobacteriota bacterium]MBI3280017.1 high frequency lysogenization protein HflD [Acidobacteriota bacterium]